MSDGRLAEARATSDAIRRYMAGIAVATCGEAQAEDWRQYAHCYISGELLEAVCAHVEWMVDEIEQLRDRLSRSCEITDETLAHLRTEDSE